MLNYPRHNKPFEPIIFKKDEEGIRVRDTEEKGITVEQVRDHPKEAKERGIILIGVAGGHIMHTTERILEALNAHSFEGNIVIVGEPKLNLGGDLSMAGFAKKMNEDMIIQIQRIEDDIHEILTDKTIKPKQTTHKKPHTTKQTNHYKGKNFKHQTRKIQHK